MFKTSVKIDRNVNQEINRKLKLGYLIGTIIGAMGLVAYIFLPFENKYMEYLLWISGFVFAFSLIFFISFNKVMNKASLNVLINEVEINQDHCVSTIIKGSEVISTLKLYYKEILKAKETANYLVLYINNVNVVVIAKKDLSLEDLKLIKGCICSFNNKIKFKN